MTRWLEALLLLPLALVAFVAWLLVATGFVLWLVVLGLWSAAIAATDRALTAVAGRRL